MSHALCCNSLTLLAALMACAGMNLLTSPARAQSAATARLGDWPQFLGPGRNGISAEAGLIDSWPDGGPKEFWRTKGGVGMSGLAVTGGRLVTMVQNDGQQWLICCDAQVGPAIVADGSGAGIQESARRRPAGDADDRRRDSARLHGRGNSCRRELG